MTSAKALTQNNDDVQGFTHRFHRSKAGKTKKKTLRLEPYQSKNRAQYKRITKQYVDR